MRQIKVLVANRPRLLRDLVVSTLTNQRDIEVLNEKVLEHFLETNLVSSIEQLQPDFLIATLENDVPSKHFHFLLKRFPNLQIIALAPHSDTCVLYAINRRIYSIPVVMSEQGILDMMRGRVQPGPANVKGPLRRVS